MKRTLIIIILFLVTITGISFYLHYNITYKVNFNTDGGTTISSIKVKSGNKIGNLKEPNKEGYTFIYWSIDGKKIDGNYIITKDITLTAVYEKNKEEVIDEFKEEIMVTEPAKEEQSQNEEPKNQEKEIKKYTVKFNTDGGNYIKNQTVDEGMKVTKPNDPTKSGYTFKEWTLDGKTYDFNKNVTKDIELKAVYTKTEKKVYKVTFNTDGGNSIKSQTVDEGMKVTKPNDPTKSGYTFKEWTLDGKTYDFNKNVTKDIELKAIYQRNASDCTYSGELKQGATYINGQYTYKYKQEYAVKKWNNISQDGWGVALTDNTSTDPVTTKLCSTINGKHIVSMQGMFCESAASSIDLSSFDTSKVTNMTGMFSGASATSLNLISFNTAAVTYMTSMFEDSKATTINLSGFDTSNVTDMAFMFSGSKATSLNLSSFDTSKVITMDSMFQESDISNLNLSSFNTSNVINMHRMFYDSKATTINLSGFDTSNVTDMSFMFSGSEATSLNLINFNTAAVTDMTSMFSKTKVKTLDLSSFDTSKVTTMTGMFSSSEATKILGLENFNTSNVTNMYNMFSEASATSLNLSSFDTSKVTTMTGMFRSSHVTTLDLSSFDTSNVTYMNDMFRFSDTTTGYARTQADADRLNATSNKPSTLTFVVK